ncbi:MAG: ribonucleotide-diphosphate reductase subunit beta, partial [Sphingomonadales bacterium]|nr:ribonucleotide-diphosphate reductase subunit beta [Sphingomonadales bacterium]
WNDVWSSFDKRKGKVANEDEAVEDEGADMFEQAGVAAE